MSDYTHAPSLKSIDLVAALAAEGYTLRKVGKSWAGNRCPSCGEGSQHKLSVFVADDRRQRWQCMACKSRGDFADFLAASRGLPMKEALALAREMYRLGGVKDCADATQPNFDPSRQRMTAHSGLKTDEQVQATNDVWQCLLTKGYTSTEEVLPYFNGRGISKATLERVVAKGLMRFLPTQAFAAYRFLVDQIGRDLLMRSGLWREGSKWPAAAFRPIVSLLPGGTSFELRLAHEPQGKEPKAVRYGSSAFPWFFKEDRNRPVKRIFVVEGIIDLLSVLDLGMVGFDDAVMGIPGVNTWNPEWFDKALMRNPDAEFVIAMDPDAAGDRVAGVMLKYLQDADMRASTCRPPDGQDWNKHLCALRASRIASAEHARAA